MNIIQDLRQFELTSPWRRAGSLAGTWAVCFIYAMYSAEALHRQPDRVLVECVAIAIVLSIAAPPIIIGLRRTAPLDATPTIHDFPGWDEFEGDVTGIPWLSHSQAPERVTVAFEECELVDARTNSRLGE